MLLGDRIKQATTAAGIKPCRGCEARAEMLNEWSRRGVLKTGFFACLAFVGGVKNSTLRLMWQAAGKQPAFQSHELALAFVRQFNTAAAVLSENGVYPTRDEILSKLLTHKGHFKTGTLGEAWESSLKLQDEVLPGWHLDYAQVKDGYRLILRGVKHVIVTDESAVIYAAPASQITKSAKDLPEAKTLRLTPYLEYDFSEPMSWLQRIEQFFVPRVYAQGCCSLSLPKCAQTCGGVENCIAGCCKGITCSRTVPTNFSVCVLNTGSGGVCNWIYSSCNTNGCNCCEAKYFGGGNCCFETASCGACPPC